jgi:uncharacterized damage-inducible protein DinB
MDTDLGRLLLDHSADKLDQLCGRIGTCLEKLGNEQVWSRGDENENAIGNIVLHLCGNVRQWIGAGVSGQPDIRVRDREFAARGEIQPAELRERLENTVRDAVAVLKTLPAERLAERVTIQSYQVTVLEAVCHVVEHFSMHTGQIIFATKQVTGEDLGFYRHLNRAAPHGEKTP